MRVDDQRGAGPVVRGEEGEEGHQPVQDRAGGLLYIFLLTCFVGWVRDYDGTDRQNQALLLASFVQFTNHHRPTQPKNPTWKGSGRAKSQATMSSMASNGRWAAGWRQWLAAQI